MKALYEDILALTDEQPNWYDMDGVPRFARFTPKLCPNIYAKEIILLLIECQSCQQQFVVEMHWHPISGKQSISEAIDKGNLGYIHYGDPPRHGVSIDSHSKCYAGDTMNSDSVKILEFWHQDMGEWERKPQYEIEWDE